MPHSYRCRITEHPEKTAFRFCSVFMLILLILPAGVVQVMAKEETPPAEKPAETKTLYVLSNQELLDQASGSLNTAKNNYLAHLRGLSQTALLLDKAKQEKNATRPVQVEDRPSSEDPLPKKVVLDNAKAQLEANKALSARLGDTRAALDKHLAQLGKTASSARNLIETINSLEMPLFEISLRIQDGTLSQSAIPETLSKKALKKTLDAVTERQQALDAETSEVNAQLAAIQETIEQAKKDGLDAQAKVSAAEADYDRELKRQEHEKLYQNYPPGRLLSELTRMHNELTGLNGDFGLAHAHFLSARQQIEQLHTKLEQVEVPSEDILQRQVRTAEAAQFMTEIKAFTAFHINRKSHLHQLKAALGKLTRHGEAFQGEAAVVSEHLSNMRVLSNLLMHQTEKAATTIETVPEHLTPAVIEDNANEISEHASMAVAAIKETRDMLAWIDKELELSTTADKLSQERQAQLKKAIEANRHTRQWDETLKKLSAKEIAGQFKKSGEERAENMVGLQKEREELKQAEALAEAAAAKLTTLQDPLLRQAREYAAQEKPTLVRDMYSQTGLAPPKHLEVQNQKTGASHIESKKEKKIDVSSYPADNTRYQNLISARTRVIEEKRTQMEVWRTRLKSLDQKLQKHHASLSSAIEVALKHYAIALELKKRIGRKELQSHEIPEGITDALKRDMISQLETEFAEVAERQTIIHGKIETDGKPDEEETSLLTLLGAVGTAVGTRLDLAQDIEKLDRDRQKELAQLSEGERKSFEQTAARRTQTESTSMEKLLAFVPSEQADKLSEILAIYYQELIDLERNQRLAGRKEEKIAGLMVSVEHEKDAVKQLLPVLQARINRKQLALDEEQTLIQAALNPEKTDELLRNYETRTGKHLIPPTQVSDEELGDFIAQSANTLTGLKATLLADQAWVELLQKRLSTTGLMAELGAYQDSLGEIRSKHSVIERRMRALTGMQPAASENRENPIQKNPDVELMQDGPVGGEIGALREERHAVRSNAAIWVLARIVLVLLVAWIIVYILNMIFSRLSKSMQQSANQNASQYLLALSFGSVIAKTTVWIIAIILTLSSLGFNITAILAGLGIGGLAMAMAARETLANLIGAITLFIERPFILGDSVKIGNSGSTAKVTGITWRTTRLTDSFGYNICVPNGVAAESVITNYSHTSPPGDYVTLYISAEQDPQTVIPVIDQALEACSLIRQDAAKGTFVQGQQQLGNMTVIGYWPWWSIDDYQNRYGARNEVWQSIWKHLSEVGINIEVSPFDGRFDQKEPPRFPPDYAPDGQSAG